jgi:uncharacterized protein YhaN
MNPLRLLTALSFLLGCCAACQDPKNSEEYRSLVTANASLQDSIQRMQQEVNDITLSMNQIEKNLVKLRRDEMQIDDIRDEATSRRNQGDRIFLILAEMDAYMEENKTLVQKLDKQLAKSRHVTEGLRRLVALQKQAILEKEAQIQELTQSMAKLKEEFTTTVAAKDAIISQQEARLTDQQKTIHEKQTTLNTGYILYGDRQQLFEQGVLQSEGGLLGKNVKLTSKLDPGLFSPIDIKKVQEIKIGVTRKQKALTIHPADSFYFVKTDGQTYLKITDPDRFWSVSKYLVVVIEG